MRRTSPAWIAASAALVACVLAAAVYFVVKQRVDEGSHALTAPAVLRTATTTPLFVHVVTPAPATPNTALPTTAPSTTVPTPPAQAPAVVPMASATISAPSVTVPNGTPASHASAVAPAKSAPRVAPATPAPALPQLTLEQKVGQMFMLGFEGTDAGATIADFVQRRHAGNAVLLGDNVVDPVQLQSLTSRLQQLATAANAGIGMLISTDEEGGTVQRLQPPAFSGLPSARTLATSDSPAEVQAIAMQTARQMRSAGLNMDLAPVLDVNDNPANPVIGDRAFGVEPQTVITFGRAFMRGLVAGGVADVAKHFPGHGNTSQDSHLTLPYVNKTAAQLEAVELAPFKDAVAQGVDAIMVAHVVYTALDPVRPASLSPAIVTGVLRNALGFGGVVMTDDLNMAAITDGYGPGEAAVMAIEAGDDLLLIDGPPATQNAMMDAVLAAVRSGRIPESRIDQSVARILALKRKLGAAPSNARPNG